MMRSCTNFLRPIFLLLGAFALAHAQQKPLYWPGKLLIADSLFSDTSKWELYTSHPSDSGRLSPDSNSINLNWSFSDVNSFKYVIGTYMLPAPLNLDTFDIFAFDFKGDDYCSSCRKRVSVEFKFEGYYKAKPTTVAQAGVVINGSAANSRWIEKIAIPKPWLYKADSIDWTRIQKISMGVILDKVDEDNGAMASSISFRNIIGDKSENWSRPLAFTYPNPPNGKAIAQNAMSFFTKKVNRDTVSGVNYTWPHDSSSNLYGLGMILKIFSIHGCWGIGTSDSIVSHATRLARAIALTQHADGYFARRWDNGIPSYDSDRIWLADQAWANNGLRQFTKHSLDTTFNPHYRKSIAYLKSTIQPDTTLRVWSPKADSLVEEKSMEAYAALLQAMIEAGEAQIADKLAQYILNHAWDPKLKYFHESNDNARPVLFTNVWLAEIFRRRGRQDIALSALGFIARAMYTQGPNGPFGVDGFGPYATWFEGVQCIASAGAPESGSLFADAVDSIRPDGSLPAYNENFTADGHWRVTNSSADATAWLYFAASGLSAFDTSYSSTCPVHIKYPVVRKVQHSEVAGRHYNLIGVFVGTGTSLRFDHRKKTTKILRADQK